MKPGPRTRISIKVTQESIENFVSKQVDPLLNAISDTYNLIYTMVADQSAKDIATSLQRVTKIQREMPSSDADRFKKAARLVAQQEITKLNSEMVSALIQRLAPFQAQFEEALKKEIAAYQVGIDFLAMNATRFTSQQQGEVIAVKKICQDAIIAVKTIQQQTFEVQNQNRARKIMQDEVFLNRIIAKSAIDPKLHASIMNARMLLALKSDVSAPAQKTLLISPRQCRFCPVDLKATVSGAPFVQPTPPAAILHSHNTKRPIELPHKVVDQLPTLSSRVSKLRADK